MTLLILKQITGNRQAIYKNREKSIILLITKLITGKGIFLINSKLSETRLIFTLFLNRSFGMFLSRGGGERVTTKTEQGGVNERI